MLKGARQLGGKSRIITNDDGRVRQLNLYDNELSGEIPAELGSLSNLELHGAKGFSKDQTQPSRKATQCGKFKCIITTYNRPQTDREGKRCNQPILKASSGKPFELSMK